MKKNSINSWVVLVLLIFIVLIPVLSVITTIGNQTEIDNQELLLAIKESIMTTGIVVLISFPLSLLCSVCICFTNIKFKALYSFLCILPMFLPPISIGFGLLSILGKNGWFFSLSGLRINLLGRIGIVLGHIYYTFPVSFLLFMNSFKSLDPSIYENAILLGIPFYKYLFHIAFPTIKKTAIAVFFQILIMSFSEYGICLVIGGRRKTLSLLIYRYVIGRLDYSSGLVLGSILVIPLIILSVLNVYSYPLKQGIFYKHFFSMHKKSFNVAAYMFLSFVLLINIVLILTLIFMGFTKNYPIDLSLSLIHLKQVLSEPYINYLFNSILIAVFSSIIGCVLSTLVAFYANKKSSRLIRKILFFIATSSYVIPGLLFGIGYLITYRGSILSGTYTIIIMANIAHFFASPFLLSYYAINQLSPEYEDIILLYDIPTKKKVFDVLIPYLKNTLLDMFFYFFSNSMITISAVAFLATSK